jgi:beta-galactosidase
MRVGVYEGRIVDQFEPFMPPQAHGLKMDTRWAALTGDGVGLAAFADAPFALGVNPFANLAEAEHHGALRPNGVTTVTLDHAHLGAGTKFHAPVEDTIVRPEAVRFQIGLRPYDPAEQTPAALWKRQFEHP